MGLLIQDWSWRIPVEDGDFTVSIDTCEIKSGESVFIFGQSGAGKTTLFSLIVGAIHSPLSGAVLRVFPRLAYVMHESALLPWLSVAGNFWTECRLRKMSYGLHGLDEFRDLLALFGLPSDVLKRRAGRLSLGMRQRVELAKALCVRPDMLIIDEGFSGIDGGTKRVVFESVLGHMRKGMAVLVATHQVMDLVRLAERVYFIADGRISSKFEFSTEAESRLRAKEESLAKWQDVRTFLEHVSVY